MVGVTAMIKALDMPAHAEVERLKQISGRAQAHVDERADPAKLNPDWREAFRAKASRVTSDDMQEVWAKVLAAEINERGSISIQTINILANMNRSDAQSFASICRFTWRGKSGGNSHVVLFDDVGPALRVLTDHESLGLVALPQHGYRRSALRSDTLVFRDKTEVHFSPVSGDEFHIPMGKVMFTPAGRELVSIVDLEDVPRHTSRYFPKCVAFWRRGSGQAYSVAVVPPKSD